jgi:hypothetical protein
MCRGYTHFLHIVACCTSCNSQRSVLPTNAPPVKVVRRPIMGSSACLSPPDASAIIGELGIRLDETSSVISILEVAPHRYVDKIMAAQSRGIEEETEYTAGVLLDLRQSRLSMVRS